MNNPKILICTSYSSHNVHTQKAGAAQEYMRAFEYALFSQNDFDVFLSSLRQFVDKLNEKFPRGSALVVSKSVYGDSLGDGPSVHVSVSTETSTYIASLSFHYAKVFSNNLINPEIK